MTDADLTFLLDRIGKLCDRGQLTDTEAASLVTACERSHRAARAGLRLSEITRLPHYTRVVLA